MEQFLSIFSTRFTSILTLNSLYIPHSYIYSYIYYYIYSV